MGLHEKLIGACGIFGLTEVKREWLSPVLHRSNAIVFERRENFLHRPRRYLLFELGALKHTIGTKRPDFFKRFDTGDKVSIEYRKVFSVLCDYDAPDFEGKQWINRKHIGYRVVGVEKI